MWGLVRTGTSGAHGAWRTHVVGEDAVQARPPQEGEPADALALVWPEVGSNCDGQLVRRHLTRILQLRQEAAVAVPRRELRLIQPDWRWQALRSRDLCNHSGAAQPQRRLEKVHSRVWPSS